MKKDHSRRRHLLKAVTWRIVGTTDTTLLAWFFTGNPLTGLKIGFTEVITKTVLYYFHERAWFKINLKNGRLRESRKRHLAKTVTWRFVGTIDTMILAWLISGNPLIGLQVGAAELVTKMALYYWHERVWYRIGYGLPKRHKDEEVTVEDEIKEGGF